MSEPLVWMRKFMEMYGSCIFALLFIFFKNIHRTPADVSFIHSGQNPHSPEALVQRSLSLQLPLQSCYPHGSFLPTNLLDHTVQTIIWTILVLTVLPTCSADICGKQESAWEVAHPRGTSTMNLRIVGGCVM